MNFLIYKTSTGEVLRGYTLISETDASQQLGVGESWVEVDNLDFGLDQVYVLNPGQPNAVGVFKPTNPTTIDKLSCYATEADKIVLTNMPVGSLLEVIRDDGLVFVSMTVTADNSHELIFTRLNNGIYTVKNTLFPYLPLEKRVTAGIPITVSESITTTEGSFDKRFAVFEDIETSENVQVNVSLTVSEILEEIILESIPNSQIVVNESVDINEIAQITVNTSVNESLETSENPSTTSSINVDETIDTNETIAESTNVSINETVDSTETPSVS